MNYGSSPAASQPLASAKGIAAPLPSATVAPPADRSFVVPASGRVLIIPPRNITEVKT